MGLSGCLGLLSLLPDSTPLLPKVGLQPVSSLSLPVGEVLVTASSNAPLFAQQYPDSPSKPVCHIVKDSGGALPLPFGVGTGSDSSASSPVGSPTS